MVSREYGISDQEQLKPFPSRGFFRYVVLASGIHLISVLTVRTIATGILTTPVLASQSAGQRTIAVVSDK